MVLPDLGRFEPVELRSVWSSESGDFTPWLAREENLRLVGNAIGIDLELEAQEKDVGPFRADILCKNTANDSWVLIENQLERTDHAHLGQLLTYSAGLEAMTVVWIAQKFTEEHRAALDWLNEHTDEQINLFGLEIELWRIGQSAIAPKFNIISQPNDWTRTVQEVASHSTDVSPHKQLQRRFWTAFRQYMEEQRSPVRCQKPLPQHWMNHAIGRSGVQLTSIVSMWNTVTKSDTPEIRAELGLVGPSAKEDFAALLPRKDEIETELGFVLSWHNPDDARACRLYVRTDADFTNESLWPQQFDWLRQHLETMRKVFAPIVRTLSVDP